jgi:Inner membrane protein YgaP-like, transmembrane domain
MPVRQFPLLRGGAYGKKHRQRGDKAFRIVLGIALLSLLFILEGNARWWGLIGIGPLLTTALDWCPAYTLIGVSTNKSKKS